MLVPAPLCAQSACGSAGAAVGSFNVFFRGEQRVSSGWAFAIHFHYRMLALRLTSLPEIFLCSVKRLCLCFSGFQQESSGVGPWEALKMDRLQTLGVFASANSALLPAEFRALTASAFTNALVQTNSYTDE